MRSSKLAEVEKKKILELSAASRREWDSRPRGTVTLSKRAQSASRSRAKEDHSHFEVKSIVGEMLFNKPGFRLPAPPADDGELPELEPTDDFE